MKFIKEFNDYKPTDKEVEKWSKYLNDTYKVKIHSHNNEKYVHIDDKSYFLTGWLFNKGRLTDKIFYDVLYNFEEKNIHKPSLRKAIKNWIELNNK
jgi:hypothetical protein